MNREQILNLITQIARVRNVDVIYVCESLKLSLIAGLQKRFGQDVEPEILINSETGEIKIFLEKKIVKTVNNPVQEISEEAAKEIDPSLNLGEKIRVELPLEEVGRMALRKAADELMFRLRSAEKNKLYEEFAKKEGEIVSGTVYQIGEEKVIVNLGLVEGYLFPRDQMKTDHYRQGAIIKAYVVKVEKTPIGPRVRLSRTHQDFIKKLLVKEVPEIRDNIVQIKAIAREASVRTKIAVYSDNEKIDPVGACVGYKRSRIENVLKELGNEKIDIIQWSKDLKLFIARALSPAKVKEVIKENDRYLAVVPDNEYPIAIGKKGKNVALAGRLTGCNIEVMKASDYLSRQIKEKSKGVSLTALDLSDSLLEKLHNAQIFTAFDLLSTPTEFLSGIIGYQTDQAEKLKQEIEEKIKEKFTSIEKSS